MKLANLRCPPATAFNHFQNVFFFSTLTSLAYSISMYRKREIWPRFFQLPSLLNFYWNTEGKWAALKIGQLSCVFWNTWGHVWAEWPSLSFRCASAGSTHIHGHWEGLEENRGPGWEITAIHQLHIILMAPQYIKWAMFFKEAEGNLLNLWKVHAVSGLRALDYTCIKALFPFWKGKQN